VNDQAHYIGTSMPTEQTQNKPRLCTDIYAVGVIGLRALTGFPSSKTDTSGAITQVSPQLAEVLDKMVSYDFSQRYQSAESALQALQGDNSYASD